MNIFLRELKANKKTVIIWSIIMVIYVYMGMQKYEALLGSSENIVEFMKMMETLPKMVQSMLGLSELDITTPIGYFGVLSFYLILMAAIHAGMLGSNIIAKEERDKTVEFLMVKPISREKVVTSKMLAGLANVVIINMSIVVPSVLYLKTLTDIPIAKEMFLFMIGMFLVQILFLIVGIGIACILKRPKKSNSFTMAILMGSFVISLIIDMTIFLENIKFLTPFKYFEAKEFLLTGRLDIGYIFLTLIITMFVLIIAYKKYRQRDFNI